MGEWVLVIVTSFGVATSEFTAFGDTERNEYACVNAAKIATKQKHVVSTFCVPKGPLRPITK